MAKHPVPKYKTSKARSRTRHSAFMSKTRTKLEGVVDKMRNLDKKGALDLRKKVKKATVKKVKA